MCAYLKGYRSPELKDKNIWKGNFKLGRFSSFTESLVSLKLEKVKPAILIASTLAFHPREYNLRIQEALGGGGRDKGQGHISQSHLHLGGFLSGFTCCLLPPWCPS